MLPLSVVITFSEEEKKYLQSKFSKMCTSAKKGDKERFDQFCAKIPAFCEEIYQIGKDMVWPNDIGWLDGQPPAETPNDCVIYSVGTKISP